MREHYATGQTPLSFHPCLSPASAQPLGHARVPTAAIVPGKGITVSRPCHFISLHPNCQFRIPKPYACPQQGKEEEKKATDQKVFAASDKIAVISRKSPHFTTPNDLGPNFMRLGWYSRRPIARAITPICSIFISLHNPSLSMSWRKEG